MGANQTTIEEHWRASEAGDTMTEHAMDADDAILEYPQSGERFRGRAAIAAERGGHLAEPMPGREIRRAQPHRAHPLFTSPP